MIAGHTHRNRRYRVRGIDVIEVGSTKDYPGQWAGYSVYEGGIRQVVRRVSQPDVIAWTEMTGRALGGLWRRWSPGSLADAMLDHRLAVRPLGAHVTPPGSAGGARWRWAVGREGQPIHPRLDLLEPLQRQGVQGAGPLVEVRGGLDTEVPRRELAR